MRSYKATKRYLLRKEWIDADACKAIVATLVISACAATVTFLSLPPGKSKEDRKYSECKEARSDPEVCLELFANRPDLTSDPASKPSESKADPYNDRASNFIKDKRDLNAQEGMWRATNILAILTIFQVFIGFFGILLLKRTLHATEQTIKFSRDTLNVTRETVKEARIATYTRGANVLLETVEIGANPINGLELNLVVKYVNFGETPAKNLMVNAGVRSCEEITGMETLPVSVNMKDGPMGIYMGPGESKGVMLKYALPVIGNQSSIHRDSCFIAVVIRYDTIFDDDPEQAKDLEFYCRVNFKAFRRRAEDGTNPVTATGSFTSLTPNITREYAEQ